MLGLMNYSAASLDRFRGSGVKSAASVLHHNRLVSGLKLHLNSEGSSPTDDLLVAVGSASATITETRYGIFDDTERQELDFHLRGLQTLINLRGGWSYLVSQGSALSWFLCW